MVVFLYTIIQNLIIFEWTIPLNMGLLCLLAKSMPVIVKQAIILRLICLANISVCKVIFLIHYNKNTYNQFIHST